MSQQVRAEDTSDKAGKLAWFLTGAVLGAAAALLYAPKSGRETRRMLSESGQKGKEAVEERSREIAEATRDMYERGRRMVDDAAELFERGRKLVEG